MDVETLLGFAFQRNHTHIVFYARRHEFSLFLHVNPIRTSPIIQSNPSPWKRNDEKRCSEKGKSGRTGWLQPSSSPPPPPLAIHGMLLSWKHCLPAWWDTSCLGSWSESISVCTYVCARGRERETVCTRTLAVCLCSSLTPLPSAERASLCQGGERYRGNILSQRS